MTSGPNSSSPAAPGVPGAVLLLNLAVAAAQLRLTGTDGDVVDQGRRLHTKRGLRVHPLQQGDGPGQAVDLDEMLNAPGISGVKGRHGRQQPGDGLIVFHGYSSPV